MSHIEASFRLSRRERQVILLAARGLADKEIARELGLSIGTVGTLWSRIRSKIGHYNRTGLVVRALLGEEWNARVGRPV